MPLLRLLLIPILWLLAASAEAVEEIRGQTASGAWYVAQAPAGWRAGDRLVLINHGYQIDLPSANPSLGPMALRQRMLERGYAIAASSYSQRGWALFRTEVDHRELVAVFAARFGAPGSVVASGGSMGGLVSMQQAAMEGLGAPVAGVYAVCAPLAGTRVWDQALDLRLAYDQICAGVSGGELPRGDDAFPYILKASELDDYDRLDGGGELALRIARCTGYRLPSLLVSSGMRQRYERLRRATGVADGFFLENMFYATYGLGDLYRDAAKIGERPALGNRHVAYPDAQVDQGIRRVDADGFAALDLYRHHTPGWLPPTVKVLSTHTSGDGLVVPEHGRALEGRLPPSQWSQAYVVEATPSHCGYSDAELLGGFEALVDWIDGAPRPEAGSLQAACERERQTNPALGACRYDASYQPGELDAQLKPRQVAHPPLDASLSGIWYDPSRPGEGFVAEALDSGEVVLAWFTYPTSAQPGDQAWFTGLGRALPDAGAVAIDALAGRRGGRFDGPLAAGSLQELPLGRVDALLQGCGNGEYRLQGEAGYGSARRSFVRLSGIGPDRCPGAAQHPAPSAHVAWSGAWFEPANPGRGLFLQVQDDGRAFLLWFTFRPDGEPAWMVGEGRAEDGALIFDAIARPVGTRFGVDFDPAAVLLEPWGTLRLAGEGCTSLRLDYQSIQPGFGSGHFQLSRLTRPLGAGCG